MTCKINDSDFYTKKGMPNNTEYDLAAKLHGLAIRKNYESSRYEIWNYQTTEVQYAYTTIKDIVRVANELEDDRFLEAGDEAYEQRNEPEN